MNPPLLLLRSTIFMDLFARVPNRCVGDAFANRVYAKRMRARMAPSDCLIPSIHASVPRTRRGRSRSLRLRQHSPPGLGGGSVVAIAEGSTALNVLRGFLRRSANDHRRQEQLPNNAKHRPSGRAGCTRRRMPLKKSRVLGVPGEDILTSCFLYVPIWRRAFERTWHPHLQ